MHAVLVLLVTIGLLTPVLMIAIMLFFHLLLSHPRLAMTLPVLGVLCLLFLYWPITQYRAVQHATPELQNLTIPEKAALISRLAVANLSNSERLLYTTRNMVRRTSAIMVLSWTTQKTPALIPYWGGHTYLPLIGGFIPRAFWPDKPQERSGKAFGNRYDLIFPKSETSVNIPWLTELFINFGPPGIFFGMTVFGILFSLIDHVFNSRNVSALDGAIGLGLIVRFVYPESNFSVMAASFPLQVLCFWIYFRTGLLVLGKILPHRWIAS
jgi:hypothetical protein